MGEKGVQPITANSQTVEPQAQQLLLDIQRRYLNADRDYVLASLWSAIKRIEETFPRFGHFLMEFIQNADDAGASRILIEILADRILILNNGTEFAAKDVASLCKVGLSSKRSGDYIGYLGVGFKSVFLISDKVAVTSGEVPASASTNHRRSPPGASVPWQVIPISAERIADVNGDWRFGFSISLAPASEPVVSRIQYLATVSLTEAPVMQGPLAVLSADEAAVFVGPPPASRPAGS